MNHKILILAFFAAFLLTSCSYNGSYRSNYQLCEYNQTGDCNENALQFHLSSKEDGYRLGFVEYDDQGQLRDRQQMETVLDEYRRLALADDVLLITFVHGWHHSAKPMDGNISSFRDTLAQISKMEALGSKQQNRKKRKVLGLYLGWRGDSLDIPVINNLTFWERKNTAHDVGLQGLTEVLLKAEEIVNVKKGLTDNSPSENSRLVVIGHSFGGAAVYTALQNIFADRFIGSKSGKTFQGDAQGFGDLVVLLNPAFEAMRFAALYDLSQQDCRNYFDTQLPRLVILTSEADYATRYAFPAGRVFSTLFESHLALDRHYCTDPGSQGIQPLTVNEGSADRNAVGHYSPFLTHRLDSVLEQKPRDKDYLLKQIQEAWSKQGDTTSLEFEGSRLTTLGRTTALNPYLNIQVDEKLINDHNDIWRSQIIAFIRDLIVISTTPLN